MDIPEFTEILKELKELKEIGLKTNTDGFTSEWYNDKQCWEKKGGMALATYRTNRFYQIKGGVPDAYVGGRKVWSKESLLEWVFLPDSALEEYHKKYKTGAKK